MIHAFESRYPELTLELKRASKEDDVRLVEFHGREFVTDNDELATELKGVKNFGKDEGQKDFWLLPEGVITGANRNKRKERYKMVSGARGAN